MGGGSGEFNYRTRPHPPNDLMKLYGLSIVHTLFATKFLHYMLTYKIKKTPDKISLVQINGYTNEIDYYRPILV